MAEISKEAGIYPQESLAKTGTSDHSILIGVPKEAELQEKRVVLTPEAVALLVNNNQRVMVESGAGKPSKFSDKAYSDAGAKVVYSSKEAFEAEVVLKVEPPTEEEIGFMKPGSCLISALQLGKQSADYIHALNRKKITAVSFEHLEDKVGGMPVVRAMSEIAGSSVMLIAAEYLSSAKKGGKGLILGGITGVPPTNVVIIGAGTVAEYAARTGLGLGASIKIFDNHLYKLRRIKQLLGQHIHGS